MLELINLSKRIGNFSLTDISFSISKGDYFMLLGASGSGKTMILEIICGLLKPDKGRVIINKKLVNHLPIQQRKLGLVYQSQCLFPHMTVFENIAFPLKSKKLGRIEINAIVNKLADEMEIGNILHRNPQKLSGGESQRVAIARTLAIQPDVLLLDEPLSFLDVQLKNELMSLLRKLNRQGQTIIHVTHDYEEVISLANKVAILDNGKVIQHGSVEEVFHKPKSEFAARLVGIKNFFKGRLTNKNINAGFKTFTVQHLEITLSTDADTCSDGYIMIHSESVRISEHFVPSDTPNNFKGLIVDVFPILHGIEVVVDIGIEISAHLNSESIINLNLEQGKQVYVHFTANAVNFIANY